MSALRAQRRKIYAGLARNCKKYGIKSPYDNNNRWYDTYTQTTENQDVAWFPTNSDTVTIMYDTRFLKSDPRRSQPISWSVTKIEDAVPEGLTKITMAQDAYDEAKDNAELMIASYYANATTPVDKAMPKKEIAIVCRGTRAVSAGGGYKKFTAEVYSDGELIDVAQEGIEVQWVVSFPDGNETKFECKAEGDSLSVKCLPYYALIGSTFTITASATVDGIAATDTITVEVTGT